MCYLGYAHPLLGISIVSNQLSYLRQSHWRWAMYCILGRLVDVCKRLCRWCLLSVILYHKFEVEDFLLSHYVKQQLLHTHTGIPIRRPLLPHTRNQIAATNLRDTGCVDSVFCQPTCGLCISQRMLDKLLTEEWGKSWNIAPQNQVTSNRRRPWKPMAFQRPCTTAWWRLVSGSWFHVGKYGGMYNYSQLSPNLLAFSLGKMMRHIFKHGGGSISTTFRGGLTQQNCNKIATTLLGAATHPR